MGEARLEKAKVLHVVSDRCLERSIGLSKAPRYYGSEEGGLGQKLYRHEWYVKKLRKPHPVNFLPPLLVSAILVSAGIEKAASPRVRRGSEAASTARTAAASA
ncbi:unnamed protein product [Mortierella alpina]